MHYVRRIVILLMLVSLLPWGAVLSAQTAQSGAHAGTGQRITLLSVKELSIIAPASDRSPGLSLAPRKCRTAVLPGLFCAADPAIHTAHMAGPRAPHRAARLLPGTKNGASVRDAPPTGPPRSA